jgi:hypothetical protein
MDSHGTGGPFLPQETVTIKRIAKSIIFFTIYPWLIKFPMLVRLRLRCHPERSEGSLRFFTEPALRRKARPFVSLRVTGGEGFRMTLFSSST